MLPLIRMGSRFLLLVLLLVPMAAAAQSAVIPDDGLANDHFGSSVAIDGGIAAFGAPFADDAGNDAGTVYIYTHDRTNWTQAAKVTASDAAAEDRFGFAVALSGDLLVVGAPFNDDAGSNSGAAYIFRRHETGWDEVAKLTASNAAAGDDFGFSVAVSGERVLIGAYLKNKTGVAYIYQEDQSSWHETVILKANDAAIGDNFGYSVALSGENALIGAPQDDDHGLNSGAAYVFSYSDQTWAQKAKLTATGAAAGDDFGYAVTIDHETALVGALFADNTSMDTGAGYVFVHSGTGWTQRAKLVADDAAANDRLGFAVAIAGDKALIGAPFADVANVDSGAAYVFERSGTTWKQRLKLSQQGGKRGDSFGRVVGISGMVFVIGIPFAGTGGVVGTGAGALGTTDNILLTPTVTQPPATTPNATASLTPLPSDTATSIPELTDTLMPTVEETETAVPTPIDTATSMPTLTDTLMPTAVETETAAPTPIDTATSVPTLTDTLMPTVEETETVVPTQSNTATLISTPIETSTDAANVTPTETETQIAIVTTQSDTATLVPTPTDTLMPTVTNTFVPTSTETFTQTAIPTAAPTVTAGSDGVLNLLPESFIPGETIIATLDDSDLNTDPKRVEQVMLIFKNSSGEMKPVVLTETAMDSHLFKGAVETENVAAADTGNDAIFRITPGESLIASYDDLLTMDGQPMIRTKIAQAVDSTKIIGFTLIDADTNTAIGALKDGVTLNLAALHTLNLVIRAVAVPVTVGSVVFELDNHVNPIYTQTKNDSPYVLTGDAGDGAIPLAVGAYRLKASPYSDSDGQGQAGIPLEIHFEVVKNCAPNSLSADCGTGSNPQIPSGKDSTMFSLDILEVVIGLGFIYFILSLITTTLTELIAQILAMRSGNLYRGIQTLLNDLDSSGVAKKFYEHPLIASLARSDVRFFLKLQQPSYIPSHTFTLTLLDLIVNGGKALSPGDFKSLKDLTVILNSLNSTTNTILSENDPLRRQLQVLANTANTIEELQIILERWFNDMMERVSGWYKRKAQLITLLTSIVVVVVFNADTVMLFNRLSNDPTMRSALAAASETAIANQLAAPTEQPAITGEATPEPSPDLAGAFVKIGELQRQINANFQIIGWSVEPFANPDNPDAYKKAYQAYLNDPRRLPISSIEWLAKIIGLALTAVAISLGAPFWFDLLNRIVNLRGSIKPDTGTTVSVVTTSTQPPATPSSSSTTISTDGQ